MCACTGNKCMCARTCQLAHSYQLHVRTCAHGPSDARTCSIVLTRSLEERSVASHSAVAPVEHSIARPASTSNAMLCCAMPCYAMLCHAMLCHAMPFYAMLCYAMPCHAMLMLMLCYAMPCYAMLCHPIHLHQRSTQPIVAVPQQSAEGRG